MQRRTPTILAVLAICGLQASAARAGGVVYPQGGFAHFSEEKTIIVWDAAKKTEHLLRALTLKGDPESFGVLMATPSVPTVAKEGDDLIDRMGQILVPEPPPQYPAHVDVLKRTQLGDFEAVTLKAVDEHALGDWFAKNRFVDKPSLRAWVKPYIDKAWIITAIRCTAQGVGDRKLEVPTIRLSFKIDAPFFPYAEAIADATDEAAYRAKSSQPQQYRGYNYGNGTHPLDVYFVADRQMQTMVGLTTSGPPVADAIRVSSATVAAALGDTKAWGFDPKSQPTWVVTHLSENVWQRTATSDLEFAPYDLPRPRPGPGITEADDRPTGPTYPSSSMAWMGDPSANRGRPASPHKKLFRYGAIALFFLIAGAAGYAVMSEQRKPKPKS